MEADDQSSADETDRGPCAPPQDHVALRPQKRGCLFAGETVDRRQDNGSVKAVSPRHCAATCALRNCSFNCRASRVTKTMSVALLLKNNPKRKKSTFAAQLLQCPQTTTFLKRKESRSGIAPRSFRLPA